MTKSFALLVNTVPFCQSFDFFFIDKINYFKQKLYLNMFFFLCWKIETEEQEK